MHICIIGAGAAGLAAAKQATDSKYNHTCVVFEQTGVIGGTWVYNYKTGLDEYGLPIHTSMYTNLRTNLPKEIMGFPDYQIPAYNKSYITQEQILSYLNDYADNFELRSHIKFYNHVKNVEQKNGKWKVTVISLKSNEEKQYEFDAVMICNGHYHTPNVPQIPGKEHFKNKQMHSHDFRDVQQFYNQNVLVIGAGPSGMDIALQISSTAKNVIMSHHSRDEIATVFPDNLSQQCDVDYMTETEIVFKNDYRASFDVVVYCTGYLYNFPFLSKECGITVQENHVSPLYKHLININQPSMCFIGLPFYVCAFSMFDLQARFYFEYLSDKIKLPSKQKMLEEMEFHMKKLLDAGFTHKNAHMMGPKQGEYYKELSKIANIKTIPPVMTKLHNESSRRFLEDLCNFREDIYKIVDEDNFVQVQ